MTALTVGHRIDQYRIVRLLGEGGMGAVYEARQEPLDRRVALKTLHPEYARNQEAVARFLNEAKVLSRLEHPSIVQVSDFGQAPDGTAYLIMEYLRGESLARRLRTLSEQSKRLPAVSALQLAWQVADVLAVSHAQGIVHRDLKPDNLMMVADPVAPGGERVKVLDFGIAKLTDARDRGAVKTDTQAVMGTPMYMSPEQCAGAGGVDAKTDVYSLGCVLYESLAGRPPFVAEGGGQLIGMHLFQKPAPLASLAPKLPTPVAELVDRLLTKDKAQRPSMSQAADELGVLLSKLAGGTAVVRSRPMVSTDPDATRAIPAVHAGSTLGQSIGQLGPGMTGRMRLVAFSGAGLILAVLLAGLLLRGGSQSALPGNQPRTSAVPPTPLPPAMPVSPAGPVPSRRPDIVAELPKADRPAPKTPISRPVPGKTEPTPKPARQDLRSPPAVRPKNPKPKAFGYEE